MKYTVEFTEKAIKSLKKLDRSVQIMIKSWMDKNLLGTENPCQHGKGLTANRKGQWRYRIGDYRVLADIQDEKLVILIIDVGHRRKIYD